MVIFILTILYGFTLYELEQISSDLRIKRYDLNELIQDVIKKQATFFIQKNN